jgi:hypothetical protein
MNRLARIGRRLMALPALALSSLLLAGAAQAALVQGDWDPDYGVPFPQLGWRGSVTIDVPDACLALGGTIVNNTVACPLMTVVGAQVEFYDLANPVPTVETLDFGGLVEVDRIFVSGGIVQALAMAGNGLVLSQSPLGVTVPGGQQAYFQLDIDFSLSGPAGVGDSIAVLTWFPGLDTTPGGRNDPGFPAILTITQQGTPVPVPAPGTLGLALAALALLAWPLKRR